MQEVRSTVLISLRGISSIVLSFRQTTPLQANDGACQTGLPLNATCPSATSGSRRQIADKIDDRQRSQEYDTAIVGRLTIHKNPMHSLDH